MHNFGSASRPDPGQDLLDWYDRHHRVLPWRIGPADRRAGIRPDPYRIWLSEVMLQQTTVAAVDGYFRAFTDRWPTVQALAAAPEEEVLGAWAGLGYYARARNLIRCARTVAGEMGGTFPDTEEGLRTLPGIGAYTAAAVAAIAFDRPSVVVDGNVERVMARLHAVREPLPDSKAVLRQHAAALTPSSRPGDHAQAVMDLGATICTPRRPACGICPLREPCAARAAGIAPELPAKRPKPAKPVRHGWVCVLTDGNSVETERRPEKGLLGGMLALPGSDWREGAAPDAPEGWRAAGEVRHTFTHFHLRLQVLVRDGAPRAPVDVEQALDTMPTVFVKALRLALKGR